MNEITNRLTILPIAGFLGLVAIAWSSASLRADSARPNFVIIFTDDQGYQDVGCFGSPDIRTPRLDAMAKQGMKFTSFYAQPICGPSRAALMTGCYPMRVAERGHTKQVHPILHEDEITVAEVLKTKGYATACFGKWDLAKHAQSGFFMDLFPTRQGFDTFYGTPTSNDRVANLYRNEELIEPASNMATLTQRYTDEAINFIRKNQERPFFVYIPHTMPHTRLEASAMFKGKSKRGLYGDVIEEIDFNVGRILDALDELKLAENTYVLFTSDNGPWLIKNKHHADGRLPGDHGGSAGPLRSGKVSTFEGGVRVPAILWAPGRVPAGTTCDCIATTMDVMPTLAALAGAEVPSDRVIDGEDIRHLFHGDFDNANPHKAYFYYLRVHLQAVRQGEWKLHLPREKEPVGVAPFSRNTHIAPADRVGFEEPFLVDLKNDVGETTNVAAENPQVVERLLGLAESMREDLGDYNRVGKNMRFFDALDGHPTKPPVPAPRGQQQRKSPQTAQETRRQDDASRSPQRSKYLETGGERKLEVVYKNVSGRDLTLDLYHPTARRSRKCPVIVFTHGGGWAAGNRYKAARGSFGLVFGRLVKEGFAVAPVTYRLAKKDSNVAMRDCVIDCKDAIRYLAKNSESLGIDPMRMCVMGDSAGGHIAQMLLLASAEQLPGNPDLSEVPYRMVAGVSWYGPCDFENQDLFNHDNRANFKDRFAARILGSNSGPMDKLARYREVSPINYLRKDSPPLLMIQGDKDTTIPVKHAYYMKQKAAAIKAPVEIMIIRNAGHNWRKVDADIDPSREAIIERTVQFFVDHQQ